MFRGLLCRSPHAAKRRSVGRLATKRILVNETLLTIAEVSVGFAGFASIVTVLGKRSGAVALQDSLRIRVMLVYSLSVAFLCFLPAILREYAVPEATVWRLSSAVLAGTALLLFFTIIRPRAGDVVTDRASVAWR